MVGEDGKQRCVHGTEIWPERHACEHCAAAWKALGIGDPPDTIGGEWKYPVQPNTSSETSA